MLAEQLTARISLVPEHTNEQDATEPASYQFILSHRDYWLLSKLADQNHHEQDMVYLLWFCCVVVTSDREGNETDEPGDAAEFYRCRLPQSELTAVTAASFHPEDLLPAVGGTLVAVIEELLSISSGN